MQHPEVALSAQALITHILVALDGSAFAERVLPHAAALAHKFGATITLLRATTPSAALIGIDPAMPGDPRTLVEAEQHEVDAYLHALAQRLRAAGLTVGYEQQEGQPAAVILERAASLGADLIAMTTHGRTGLQHFVFGSVTEEVLQVASCPILLVRVRD